MNVILKHLRQVEEGMTLLDQTEVLEVLRLLKNCRTLGGTAYVFGNGGSASTASHFANDLMKMGRVKSRCINDHISVVTAYGNDEGWSEMYKMPLQKVFNAERDIAIGISCSGNSENVINALGWASSVMGTTVGITGLENNSMINLIPEILLVHARVPDIRVQEDLHLMVCHAIARGLAEGE